MTRKSRARILTPVLTLVASLMATMAWATSAADKTGLQPLSDQAVFGADSVDAARKTASQTGLRAMSDDEMAKVSGQALFQTQMIQGDGTEAGGTNGVNFYRAGLDAELDLNMNIDELELGRTGSDQWPTSTPFDPDSFDNYYDDFDPNVDVWARDVAFGCTANASGDCVDSGSATQLNPLSLLRPYLEFAIKNDDTKTMREVVGIRLGAENIEGPLSFGQMRSFSGYLSATAQLTMEGMTNVAATCGTDHLGASGPGATLTPTYGPSCGNNGDRAGLAGTGVNTFSGNHNTTNTDEITVNASQWEYTVSYMLSDNYNGEHGSLGLADEEVCATVVFEFCGNLSDITASFDSDSTAVLDAQAAGKRLTQADVLDPGLATLIDNVVSTLTIGDDCNAGTAICDGGSWFPDLLRGPAGDAFKGQVCQGLGLGEYGNGCSDNDLNTTPLGYNLTNFHQVNVDTSNLGLSFQSESVRYPGYVSDGVMEEGWSMYLPDAFHLDVSEPAGVLTNNIASGAAGRGDLVALDPVHDNCWGTADFC